jgi:hypothetical protein
MQEPRDPLLKVLILGSIQTQTGRLHKYGATGGAEARVASTVFWG